MAGIYLHIPFCKQACHYCDFHFSTRLEAKSKMLQAISKEIVLQKEFLKGEPVTSIYFGGGTPSLLEGSEVAAFLALIRENFQLEDDIEVTLEANPDDLSPDKLKNFYQAGINRLSIGIQSFHDPHLRFMNRAHNSSEALSCLSDARKVGFKDFSIDLIYGIPSESHHIWKEDIRQALQLGVNHISAYCLTIEPGTVFGNWLGKKKMKPIDEEFAAQQFEILYSALTKKGFEQYEISNFCLPGHYSRHNSSYWRQQMYLGAGPSAHSYDGHNRQFNVSNNQRYIRSIEQGLIPCTRENLTPTQKVNEYLLTSIRTRWGCSLGKLERMLPGWGDLFKEVLTSLITSGHLKAENDTIFLSEKGKLMADEITLKLFKDE